VRRARLVVDHLIPAAGGGPGWPGLGEHVPVGDVLGGVLAPPPRDRWLVTRETPQVMPALAEIQNCEPTRLGGGQFSESSPAGQWQEDARNMWPKATSTLPLELPCRYYPSLVGSVNLRRPLGG
jgi:hypothetical protein